MQATFAHVELICVLTVVIVEDTVIVEAFNVVAIETVKVEAIDSLVDKIVLVEMSKVEGFDALVDKIVLAEVSKVEAIGVVGDNTVVVEATKVVSVVEAIGVVDVETVDRIVVEELNVLVVSVKAIVELESVVDCVGNVGKVTVGVVSVGISHLRTLSELHLFF